MNGELHIHAPTGFTFREIRRCRRCRVKRRMVTTWFGWYGPITRCCRCGAYTNDGYLYRARKYDLNTARLCSQTWPTLPNRAAAYDWMRSGTVL